MLMNLCHDMCLKTTLLKIDNLNAHVLRIPSSAPWLPLVIVAQFFVMCQWPWKYGSRSKFVIHDTPSLGGEYLYQVWKRVLFWVDNYGLDMILLSQFFIHKQMTWTIWVKVKTYYTQNTPFLSSRISVPSMKSISPLKGKLWQGQDFICPELQEICPTCINFAISMEKDNKDTYQAYMPQKSVRFFKLSCISKWIRTGIYNGNKPHSLYDSKTSW